MGPLADAELRALLATPQVRKYAQAVDRLSAHEKLAKPRAPVETAPPAGSARPDDDGVSLADVLNSPLARTVANAFTRGVLGALIGPTRRRRRY